VGGKRQEEPDKHRPPGWGREVAALATRQQGVVSNSQLRRLALSREAIRYRIESGYLHRIHHGVYLVGHRTLTQRAEFIAALLACGPDSVISHRSAADVWDLRADHGSATVTVPHPRGPLPRTLRVRRSRMLAPQDVTTHEGIRVTSMSRTLLDLAAISSRRELARLVDRAERLRLFDLTAIEEVLSRARGRRGARGLRLAIADWRPRDTRRELEDRFADLIETSWLDDPQQNVFVDGERDRHMVDAYWPEARLVVELDSFEYHHTRRDRERDAEKTADLELAGYRVVRLTWDDATVRADRTLRRLDRLIRGGI
jgi:hypothetical protein